MEVAGKAAVNRLGAQLQGVGLDESFNLDVAAGRNVLSGGHGVLGLNSAARRRKVNSCDERFLRQEESIRRGLERALARRRIGLRASEICRSAEMANSTFYAHYRNCDEALVWYELALEAEFVKSLPQGIRRDLAFTLLLNFVSKHQHYFASAFRSRNMYLLARLVRHACVPTVELNQRAYILYLWSVEAMIWCWGECDKFSAGKMEIYRKRLMMLRVMDYGL